MRPIVYLSWLSLAAAIALLVFVYLQADIIRAAAERRATTLAEQDQQIDRSAHAQRVAAILVETEAERAMLDQFARLDVVAAVELLEQAGKSAGVIVTVTGANTETSGSAEGGESLKPIAFSINASGSYAALMHAVELYERLPVALQIDQLDIERDQAVANGRTWNLSLRVRMLAIAPTL